MNRLSQTTQNGFGNCWATDRCTFVKEHGEEACRKEMCVAAYLFLKSLYDQSGMPQAYQRVRLTSLTPGPGDPGNYSASLEILGRYVKKVATVVPDGTGLLLYAKNTPKNPMGTGTGKTSAAAAIMNEWFLKTAYTANLEPMGSWVAVSDWLEYLRPSFDGEVPAHLSKERLQTVPLVVLDDLGAEKASEWVQERIYNVLNHRVANGLTTIVTSNYAIEELASRLGQRVASRLATLVLIDLSGTDHRRKAGW